MRYYRLAIIPLLGALALAPRRAVTQISASIQFGQNNWGSQVRVYPYSADVDGDWRTNYRRWQPVTLYNYQGRFYTRAVPDARPVAVYRFQNQYFLPPRDEGWVNVDRRYRYDYRPQDDDYNLITGILNVFGNRPPPAWGSEVVVNPYTPEQFGDWRTMYARWRPVTLYFRDNRYFARSVPGSRPVALYSWNGQYFLPPQDRAWDSYDRRFNYGRRPVDEDYNAVQRPYQNQGANVPFDQRRQGQLDQNALDVSIYAPDVHGDWHTAYNQWEPVTVYGVNGKYYPTQVPGSRQLMVYRWQNHYFLPPRDQGWYNMDRRYDYRLRPSDDDYNNARRP